VEAAPEPPLAPRPPWTPPPGRDAERSVEVTIGRVEIRAERPQPPRPPRRAVPRRPSLSLSAYLARRNGRRA
jgi:hypothetical protein